MTSTGYLTHDANLARLEQLRRSASRRRRPRVDTASEAISIRRAEASDRASLERLAALDSSEVPSGELLIAEVEGEPRAAVQVAGGATIADPFERTAYAVELLGARLQPRTA